MLQLYRSKKGRTLNFMSGRVYEHQLDAKNRMRIPAKLREELGNDYSVTLGTGGCLYVYSADQMSEVKDTLKKINPYKAEQLKVARYILSNTWDAEEDKQGRILLPENLRKFAKIEKNVVVYKGPVCVEIWSKEVYDEYFSDVDFNDLADAFESLKNNG